MLLCPTTDLSNVSAQHQLPEEPVRSKGQATLQPAGYPQFTVTIRDVSAYGIGVLTSGPVAPGTRVVVPVHDNEARGAVESCRQEGGECYLVIALDRTETLNVPPG